MGEKFSKGTLLKPAAFVPGMHSPLQTAVLNMALGFGDPYHTECDTSTP